MPGGALPTDKAAGLPSGTVTFLFTDIESSGEGWVSRPEWMSTALAEHDVEIRAALVAHDGIELKHLGDGLCAVFASATSAIAASAEAQRRLQQLSSNGNERLRVRMGLHTGEAVPDRGDYFGQTITRAARVMDAANGDQILCSSSVRALAEQTLSSVDGSLTLTDVGEVELPGIGIERLFLLGAQDLVVDDRPVRGKQAATGELPRNLQSFVGRADEIEALSDLARLNRLVTLIGVGGVGKSRLAIELGARLADNHPDGVYWCSLASLSDAAAVPLAIMDTLGATPRDGLDPIDGLATYLNNQKLLLVLDNCEHLSDAVAEVVQAILDQTTGPNLVATSRRPLRLTGEHVWPVSPLSQPDDQVALFVDRARERDPRFAPTVEEIEAIGDICARLDGLPLAVELAAARVRIMSPIAILDRLDDRFRLLGTSHDGMSRRLIDAVEWSYEQLDTDEARLFRWLSIFRGGFSIDAVEMVCAADPDNSFEILDHLETLIDDSLVLREERGDGERFVMLETLRQFGYQQLDASGELGEATGRYIDYFLDLLGREVGAIHSSGEFAAWDVLDAEWSNIRAVHNALADRGDFDRSAKMIADLFYFGGYSLRHEVSEWAEDCLANPASDRHPLLASLYATFAFGAYCRLALEQSTVACERGLTAEPDNGRCYLIAVPANLSRGGVARSEELLGQMFERHDTLDRPERFWAYVWKALYLAWVERDGAGSAEFAAKANDLANEIRSPSLHAAAQMINGVALTRSDPDAAVTAFRSGLKALGAYRGRSLIGRLNEEMLADLLAAVGEPIEALEACRMALESALENDWLFATSGLMDATVLSLLRAGRPEVAGILAGCAEAHGANLRQRSVAMLERVDGIDAIRLQAAGMSLRDSARMALDAIAEHQHIIDL